jgi:hypothetical protein
VCNSLEIRTEQTVVGNIDESLDGEFNNAEEVEEETEKLTSLSSQRNLFLKNKRKPESTSIFFSVKQFKDCLRKANFFWHNLGGQGV